MLGPLRDCRQAGLTSTTSPLRDNCRQSKCTKGFKSTNGPLRDNCRHVELPPGKILSQRRAHLGIIAVRTRALRALNERTARSRISAVILSPLMDMCRQAELKQMTSPLRDNCRHAVCTKGSKRTNGPLGDICRHLEPTKGHLPPGQIQVNAKPTKE